MTDKRPRQYAAEIVKLKSRAERKQALENVPEHLRDWVKRIVEISYGIRANKAGYGKKG